MGMSTEERERATIRIVKRNTGEESDSVVIAVLDTLSRYCDSDSAISCIKLAQYYELDPVEFAKKVRVIADEAEGNG